MSIADDDRKRWRAICKANPASWTSKPMLDLLDALAEAESDRDLALDSHLERFVDVSLFEAVQAERDALRAMLNTPRTDDFFEAVRTEAAHQIDRWGVEHDAGKRREDWVALLAYLIGKATKAHYDADADKLKHHVVTIAAVCLNWLRAENGESTAMRPGIGPEAA